MLSFLNTIITYHKKLGIKNKYHKKGKKSPTFIYAILVLFVYTEY